MPTLEERMAMARHAMNIQPPSIVADQSRQNKSGGMQAFGSAAAERYLGNIANIPDVVANLAARSANQAMQPVYSAKELFTQGTPRAPVQGMDVRDMPVQPRQQMIPTPAVGQEFVPGPTAYDLMGLAQRGGELAGAVQTGDFSQFSQSPARDQEARMALFREQNPIATGLGAISGDMLTLITARQPIAKARAESELAQRVGATAAEITSQPIALAPTVKEALKNITSGSGSTRTLLNRLGRAGETGMEGFVLSALNGQADPTETAAYAAGTQAAGSLLLGSMSGLFSGGIEKTGLKLAVSAAAIGGMIQMFKSATPGGQDFILPSIEAGFDKVALGIAAGVVSGMAGMGRVTSKFPVKALPEVADAISALPRAATISVITEILDDPAAQSVVQKASTDPLYFNPAERRRIERAMTNENVSLSATIEDLMKNAEFRKKFEAISQ